jgi:hypothetical protein
MHVYEHLYFQKIFRHYTPGSPLKREGISWENKSDGERGGDGIMGGKGEERDKEKGRKALKSRGWEERE